MIKHFAATAYIVSKIGGEFRVLLHKHKKLGIWIGVGGHVEKGENPKQAVLREAKEETDLEITLVNQFCIQEEKIPKYGKEAAHCHIDFIYFAFAKNPENIRMEEEYGWFSLKELDKMDLREEAKHAAQNAIKIVRY
ncbi:NUDIX domain-containing protein [Candidatus Daviesbacteria bacterium]|nr:NUDIX domain-containing protein [Candidatus Daviesbacteria bacterium]